MTNVFHNSTRHTAWITRSLKEIMSDLSIFVDGRFIDIDVAEGYKWWMEMLSHEILALEMNEELDEFECKAVDYILKAFSVINDVVDNLQNTESFSTMTITTETTLVPDGSVGRPKFDISEIQFRTLLEKNFSAPDIAKILGVSVSTIRR